MSLEDTLWERCPLRDLSGVGCVPKGLGQQLVVEAQALQAFTFKES